MSLKRLFKIFMVFTFTILISCKKDIAVPTTTSTSINPTPTPFIEYRTPFVGNYLGSYTSYQTIFHTGVALYEPYDIFYIPQNYLVTVQKSTTSDSTLVLKYFGKTSIPYSVGMNSVPSAIYNFKIWGNGKHYFYKPSKLNQSHSITFRNDSLYVSTNDQNSISSLVTYNDIKQYKGVKQ